MSDPLQERSLSFVAVVVIVLLIATAVALRFYHLGGTVFYSDQAFSWRVASSETIGELCEGAAGDVHPPGYFLVIRYWMKLAGSSPVALRGLSVFVGLLNIFVFYRLYREVLDWADNSSQERGSHRISALFAVALISVHYVPVEASRLARMYSLGILLATTSAWLLLRAVRSEKSPWRWWLSYGLAAAAFCYTHNYAFFTLAAHAVVVIWFYLSSHFQNGRQATSNVLVGFLGAASLAFLLYLPWVPSLFNQLDRVQIRFGDPVLTVGRIEQILLSWMTGIGFWDGAAYHPRVGIEYGSVSTPAMGCFIFLEVLTAWFFYRGDRAGLFFTLLTTVPWGLGLLFSWIGESSIISPHYLAFAHVGLIGMIGVAFSRLRFQWARVFFGVVVFFPSLYGTWLHLRLVPTGPPAICEAAEYLKEHYRESDIVLTSRFKPLLELKYHANQLGIENFHLRSPVPVRPDGGHINLISAISTEEYLWPDRLPPSSVQRIWVVRQGWYDFPEGWRLVETKTYQVEDDWEYPSYTISLYQRDKMEDE